MSTERRSLDCTASNPPDKSFRIHADFSVLIPPVFRLTGNLQWKEDDTLRNAGDASLPPNLPPLPFPLTYVILPLCSGSDELRIRLSWKVDEVFRYLLPP